MTVDTVAEVVKSAEVLAVPGGESGAAMLTVGVDVQAPEKCPTLYTAAVVWLASGHALVVSLVKLTGWAALAEYLRELRIDVQGGGIVTPEVLGIDCGAFTGDVLDFCRHVLFSRHSGAVVTALPLRYQSHVKSTAAALVPPTAS